VSQDPEAFSGPSNEELSQETVECPSDDPRGLFSHDLFCDVYWDCSQNTGVGVFTPCDNGLVFSPTRYANPNLNEPCDYPFNVNCTGYELYNEARGTKPCIYENGVFPHEDPEVCDQYYTCETNKVSKNQCPPGTRYDPKRHVCANKVANDTRVCKNKKVTKDGFQCFPEIDYFTPAGQKLAHPKFADPADCRKFYYCLNGEHPRTGSCDEGLVFDDENKQCQEPSTVIGCENYYDPVE